MNNTERALAELFAGPAKELEQLDTLLRQASPKHVRRALVDMVVSGGLDDDRAERILDAVAVLGLQQEKGRVGAILRDEARPLPERVFVLRLLRASGDLAAVDLESAVAPDDVGPMIGLATEKLVASIPSRPQRALDVTIHLREAAERNEFAKGFGNIEAARRARAVPASLVYADALAHMELADDQLELMLALVEDEASDAALELLASILVGADEIGEREWFRAPWMRLRARLAKPLGGECIVTTPDSSGARALFGWFRDADEQHTLVQLTIKDGMVGDTWMDPWVDDEHLEALLDELVESAGVEAEELTLAAAAELARAAGQHGSRPEHAPALLMFETYGAST